MELLTKLVLGMTKWKNYYAKQKKFDKFAEIKSVIEWF